MLLARHTGDSHRQLRLGSHHPARWHQRRPRAARWGLASVAFPVNPLTMVGLCQCGWNQRAACWVCSRATALPEVQGREVSWGKQTWVLPAASGEPGHGCRRVAVTKLCQAHWSSGDSVTQRHTSGSLSFTRVLWQGVGPATNHGVPPAAH